MMMTEQSRLADTDLPLQGLCCTNPLGDVFPLTPDGFSLRPPYAVCQEL